MAELTGGVKADLEAGAEQAATIARCPRGLEIMRAYEQVLRARPEHSIEYRTAERQRNRVAGYILTGEDFTEAERDEWMADADALLPRPDAVDEFLAAVVADCVEARS